MQHNKPLRLLLLREKKVGHFRQVDAIAQIIERMTPTVAQSINIRPRWFAPDELRQRIMRLHPARPDIWMRILYGSATQLLQKPTLIIGSGRPTIAAGMLLANYFDSKFVYRGWADNYDRSLIALSLTSSPERGRESNAAYVPYVSLINPETLPHPRPLRDAKDLRGAHVALLIGGDAQGHAYSRAEWDAITRLVSESATSLGIKWHVSTSRRSPAGLAERFAPIADRHEIVEFIDYNASGPGSADHLFATDAIVVTSDSRAMLGEALCSQRPVVALKCSTATDPTYPGLALLKIQDATVDGLGGSIVSAEVIRQDPHENVRRAIASLLSIPAP